MSEFDPSDDLRQPAEDRHAVDLDENRLDDLQSLADSLQTLPVLEDDIYLRLQAFNLGLVDSLLREWERGLLAEYHEKEHTPIPTMTIVGAVGQLWVFGLYELLRTWRQRVREVLAFAEELATLDQQARERRLEEKRAEVHEASADPARPNPAHWNGFERVANDRAFLDRLQDTLDRSEWPFRKLEALRVHLAKHEVPKAKGSYAMSPGYTRIDEVSQSICWEVSLGDMEVEILSRREIADMCSRFGTDKTVVILPKPIQKAMERIALHSYGVKRVMLVLASGAEHEAFVAWNRQILKVVGLPPVAIKPSEVVAVRAAARMSPSAPGQNE
jgi:hypothetical protein